MVSTRGRLLLSATPGPSWLYASFQRGEKHTDGEKKREREREKLSRIVSRLAITARCTELMRELAAFSREDNDGNAPGLPSPLVTFYFVVPLSFFSLPPPLFSLFFSFTRLASANTWQPAEKSLRLGRTIEILFALVRRPRWCTPNQRTLFSCLSFFFILFLSIFLPSFRFFFFYFLLLFYSPTFVLCLGKHRDAATGIKIVLGKI